MLSSSLSGLSTDAVERGGPAPLETFPGRVVNAMTVDVEDFFHVSGFDGCVPREDWDGFESRVCRNTDRLLEMFADAGAIATFFVLGWVAERFPGLIRRIAAQGHEVASHGYAHRLVYGLTRAQFAEDLRRATGCIEQACGAQVLGYRAPSYSITRSCLWALDELLAQGFVYDASIFPIHHDRYGIPDGPRHAHLIRRANGNLWEWPGSTVRFAGHNLPIAGGGYFRLLPYGWTRWGMRHLNEVEGKPAIFYLHPWEIDPEQPRVPASRVSRFRHYRNLAKTEPRLRRLLSEFRFDTAISLLSTTVAGSRAASEFSMRLYDCYAAAAPNSD